MALQKWGFYVCKKYTLEHLKYLLKSGPYIGGWTNTISVRYITDNSDSLATHCPKTLKKPGFLAYLKQIFYLFLVFLRFIKMSEHPFGTEKWYYGAHYPSSILGFSHLILDSMYPQVRISPIFLYQAYIVQ